jgi:quercetin dioxygenase-like cupin family protein
MSARLYRWAKPEVEIMSEQTDASVVVDLSQPPGTVAADSIVSRTFYGDEQVKAVLFTFAPGQELSEHTAGTAAIIHILHGEAELTLAGERRAAGPGTWAHLPARTPHALAARTEVTMLLLLLK